MLLLKMDSYYIISIEQLIEFEHWKSYKNPHKSYSDVINSIYV